MQRMRLLLHLHRLVDVLALLVPVGDARIMISLRKSLQRPLRLVNVPLPLLLPLRNLGSRRRQLPLKRLLDGFLLLLRSGSTPAKSRGVILPPLQRLQSLVRRLHAHASSQIRRQTVSPQGWL